ncbi:Sau3AI family type II restriction endonuclease [Apilactobacillus micheneri]|uniref:Sau3AI family type II restriction endonuclease n=1 Tax=Apilactobacillus micheneri TaxID=1899430 RepID=UPI000D513ACA|nr:Sau3AI family type II restriction endonuclease [Apilactobacillus micheneri]GAY79366.1 type-2 restriction enzyme Sau3AI [Apilactobacillus micheneri]
MKNVRTKYSNKEQVHNKALKIKGKTQGQLIKELKLNIKGNKNAMGDVFESWFGKTKDSSSEPDLGVSELKATPFKALKKSKNGKIQYSAKERLVLNIINYMDIVNEDFKDSHFFHKNKVLEIAFYEYSKEFEKNNLFFKYIFMYQMSKSPVDFKVIQNDWEIIKKYVLDGKADELSERATNYLAACTKGANRKSVRNQPYSSKPAKQRAFSLKSSFMTNILRNYIIGNKNNDSIIKNPIELENNSIEDIISKRFEPYIGKSQKYLMEHFNVKSNAKSKNNILVRAMLNINKKDSLSGIDEFEKASIVPKTIQFNANGINSQNMQLPTFYFEEMVNQNWTSNDGLPEAELNRYLSESKFLFIIFQTNKNGNNIFKGTKIYSVPTKQLNGTIKKAWEDTKNKLNKGVHLKYDKKRDRVSNNFIGSKDNMIVHVRPHSNKSSYVDDSNSNKLPVPAVWTNKPYKYSDDYMTTQCFFFNNKYIREIVKDILN